MSQQIQTKQTTEQASLRDKAILITGGTTGIGRATAIHLAAFGPRMLIFGRGERELKDALRDIKSAGGNVIGLTADSSKKEDVERIFDKVDIELGDLDILINNAALGAETIEEMSYDEQEYIVRTNLLGYMTIAHEAIKRLKTKKDGQILFVGSMSADVREKGSSVYVATKSGIQGFVEALRKEVNEFGIRVSLVEPGEVGTDMNELTPEEQRQKQGELKQLKAEDIADCIAFILTRPKRIDIIEVKIRPHLQLI